MLIRKQEVVLCDDPYKEETEEEKEKAKKWFTLLIPKAQQYMWAKYIMLNGIINSYGGEC